MNQMLTRVPGLTAIRARAAGFLWFVVMMAVLLSGCAGMREPPAPQPPASVPPPSEEAVVAKPIDRPQVVPAPLPEPPARPAAPANDTVLALLSDARAQYDSGNLAAAAASLERALRIEPRNAQLWNRLAHVRLKQGRYAQAASLAAKSSSLAAGNASLLEDNQAIIQLARQGG